MTSQQNRIKMKTMERVALDRPRTRRACPFTNIANVVTHDRQLAARVFCGSNCGRGGRGRGIECRSETHDRTKTPVAQQKLANADGVMCNGGETETW